MRPVSIALTMLFLISTFYSLLVDGAFSTQALKPSIVATLWSLQFFAFLQIFKTIPPSILPIDGFFRRLSIRIKLAFYSLLALVVIATSLLLLWMSIKLLLL